MEHTEVLRLYTGPQKRRARAVNSNAPTDLRFDSNLTLPQKRSQPPQIGNPLWSDFIGVSLAILLPYLIAIWF